MKAEAVSKSFDAWAVARIRSRARCTVEPSMTCLPLKHDPICSACREANASLNKEANAVFSKEAQASSRGSA